MKLVINEDKVKEEIAKGSEQITKVLLSLIKKGILEIEYQGR